MPTAYWCVLVAALLPLVFFTYAVRGGHNNNAPRDSGAALTGAYRRAHAAHQNGYDNFPFFAAAVIIAVTLGAPIATVNLLSIAYVAIRFGHGVAYIADQAAIRSALWVLGLIVNIAIFVLPAFK